MCESFRPGMTRPALSGQSSLFSHRHGEEFFPAGGRNPAAGHGDGRDLRIRLASRVVIVPLCRIKSVEHSYLYLPYGFYVPAMV